MDRKTIEFIRTKDFLFVQEIGQGGTGKTILIKDEIIDELFVCKKYSPYYEHHKDLFFKNFVDEIKILHKLHHKNLVRVFNYYLYPEKKTGYILMEHISGQDIRAFISDNPHRLNDVFVQTINGFVYLEQNKILHRDIRPNNILISKDGLVKIIDFGFGKKIKFEDDFDKSITLNWRYDPPNDFMKKIYDFRTEIYFIGKLFEEIIKENIIDNFEYLDILSRMTAIDFDIRISKFALIQRGILTKEGIGFEFTEEEKNFYKRFATGLQSIFERIEQSSDYITDIDKVVSALESVYRNSMLEEYIQNPNTISNCFVTGAYYFNRPKIELSVLKNFIRLMNSASADKKKIIVNNIWQRLDSIKRYEDETYDLPF